MAVRRMVLVVVVLALLGAVAAVAAGPAGPGAPEGAAEAKGGIDRGLLALGAGLAIGLAGLGTGIAQSRIGAAGVGAIAEEPESLGVVIILLTIPETVVILGFVVAAIILDFRGYDTLGETTVVFTAAIGVLVLVGGARRRRSRKDEPK